MKPLTETQRKVLAAIDRLTLALGYPPTYREVASDLGVTTNAVAGVEKHLVRAGFLGGNARQHRTWQVRRRWDGDRCLYRGQWYRIEVVGKAVAG